MNDGLPGALATSAESPGRARVLRAHVLHVPRDPFEIGPQALEAWSDGAVAIDEAGRVTDLGEASEVLARQPRLPLVDARDAILLPGLVDAHVHYPQVGVIGALGLPLLPWLAQRTFPHETRFADLELARREASTFVRLLLANGTTTALVFGAHFAPATEALFEAAAEAGLRLATGLVVADRLVPKALRTTPDEAYAASLRLATRWHGRGRLRYALTPRFAPACSDELLAACGAVARERPELTVTSHLNESPAEIAHVRRAFPRDGDYLAVYERHGLVRPGAVYAHDLHPSDDELARLADAGAAVAHCPSSNAFLGSGAFPLRRHRRAGVAVALGTDVGAGTSLSLLHEGLQAYLTQKGLAEAGEPLAAPHVLWLATRAGADAIGMGEHVGDLRPGRAADLVLLRPRPASTLAATLRYADSAEAVLAACLTLAREDAVAQTWVQGEAVHPRRAA